MESLDVKAENQTFKKTFFNATRKNRVYLLFKTLNKLLTIPKTNQSLEWHNCQWNWTEMCNVDSVIV
jgi:hypothetical protein